MHARETGEHMSTTKHIAAAAASIAVVGAFGVGAFALAQSNPSFNPQDFASAYSKGLDNSTKGYEANPIETDADANRNKDDEADNKNGADAQTPAQDAFTNAPAPEQQSGTTAYNITGDANQGGITIASGTGSTGAAAGGNGGSTAIAPVISGGSGTTGAGTGDNPNNEGGNGGNDTPPTPVTPGDRVLLPNDPVPDKKANSMGFDPINDSNKTLGNIDLTDPFTTVSISPSPVDENMLYTGQKIDAWMVFCSLEAMLSYWPEDDDFPTSIEWRCTKEQFSTYPYFKIVDFPPVVPSNTFEEEEAALRITVPEYVQDAYLEHWLYPMVGANDYDGYHTYCYKQLVKETDLVPTDVQVKQRMSEGLLVAENHLRTMMGMPSVDHSSFVQAEEHDGYVFELVNGMTTLTSVPEDATVVDLGSVVPASLAPVALGENAFAGCKNLARVVATDAVSVIRSGAFTGCDNVVVQLPETVSAQLMGGTAEAPFTFGSQVKLAVPEGAVSEYLTQWPRQCVGVFDDYSMSDYLSTLLFGGWDVWAGVFPTAEEFNEAVNAQFAEQENYLRGLMGLDAISGTGELAYHYDASAWLEEQLQWFAPLPSPDDPWDWPSDDDADDSDSDGSGDATGDGGTDGDAGNSGDFDADDPWDVPFNSPDAVVGERDEQVGVESRPADGKTPVQPVIS